MGKNSVIKAWEDERRRYQKRYYEFYRKYKKNTLDMTNRGHMEETSYVLINIFGLTSKQVVQIEKNGGYTNKDLDEI